MLLRSAPPLSRAEANEWRRVCGVMSCKSGHRVVARLMSRWMARVESFWPIGLMNTYGVSTMAQAGLALAR